MHRFPSWKQRLVAVTAASALSVGLVTLTAWGQEDPSRQVAPKPVQKTFTFEFRDTPWDKVLDWLADNSGGMPVVGTLKPQGSFNFISPAGKKYTLPQIIDILNSSLLKDKIIILRNKYNYMLVSSEEPQSIDTTNLPNITVDDLEIDKPYDQQRFGTSELCQITFTLNSISVDEAELNLTSRKGPFGKFQKIPRANMLLVTDTVSNLRHMKKLLDTIDPASGDGDFEVFALRPSVDGTSMETSVKGLFNLNPGQTNPVPNAPKIQYEPTQNKLLVKGDKAQLRQIRNLLQNFNALKPTAPVEPGKQGTPQASVEDSIRTVTLKTGNASQYVSNLIYMLESLRANPVYSTYEPVLAQELENSRKGLKPQNTGKVEQLIDEARPPVTIQDKPGDPKKPVFIATLSRTDGIMIGSDDPDALDFAEQIIVYLTKAGDEYYEVIPLKNSNAQTVRDTLDELINGKRQQGGNPFQAMMPFGGGGRSMGEQITGPTVRLAADKRTNSILVRAPRQIVVTIRRFIETELDVNNIDQKLQLKPRIVKLVNADATEMANVLKEIYREYVEQRPTNNQQPNMPFNPFMQQQRQQEPERSIKFYVAANVKDNSLVMNCPDILWDEVNNLLQDLDKEAVDANRQVKVINVGKADPQMLQRAVDAITGKNRTNAQGAQGQMDPAQAMRNAIMQRFGGMGGMGGFGGGNQGGGNRGNFGGGGNRGGGNRGGGGGRGGRQNRTEDPPPIFAPVSQEKPGGSDFFADRVKEDPRTKVTFAQDNQNNNTIQQTGAQAPAGQPQVQSNQPPGQPQPPQDKSLLAAPRGDVVVEVLPDGQVVVIGAKEDIAEIEEILKQLATSSPSAETELKMFPLEFLDATAATNQLSTIFARYNPIVRIISSTSAMGAPAAGGGTGGIRPGGFGQAGIGQGGFGQGGFGQGAFGQMQQQQPAPAPQPIQPGSMLIMSILRQNSILIGAPKTAMEEIEKVIKLIDKPNDPKSIPKIINLRRANAQSIATTLQQFYAQRYGSAEPNEIRIFPDVKLNTLLVHAGPEDLKEIMNLVEFFDKAETRVVNEVRIKQLKNADAQTLATLLQQALSQALLGTATQQGTQGQQGFQQPNIFGGGGLAGLFGNQANRFGTQGTATQDRRGVSLAFTQPGQARIETGLLDDVGIYADVRTNRLVISAPPESISMLEKLIDELDVPPTITADVKVFRLKNTDANQALQTLMGVFLGNQQRIGGQQGGFGNLGGFQQGGFGNLQQQQMMNFSASQGQGPQPLIPRFSVDLRTNSLIVAAGRGDMILIEVLLNNLDSSAIRDRQFQVIRLKNNQAGNVATNLNSFFRNEITILQLNDLTTFTQSDREVTVIADATNNSLIVGASQRYFPEVIRLIDQLDIELAQVAIQVLIAKVDLDNSDEFGVEVGLQSPVLFQRSLFNPQPVTTSPTQPAIGNPGFNWNNVTTTNQNNATNINSSIVGMQGLTNYGLGRARNGIGGFVFSAASDSVNVLVRALRTQGRIEVLSRPQIVTRDNQQALISVGQQVPIITGVNINAQGLITNNIEQQQVGIILKVLPQISPDGRVVMRVEPQVSSISPSTVDLGNGVQGTILDQTIASTTIDAMDGKTVVIGGLISKRDEKLQRGIPWLGDLPYIGALFRYRSHIKQKSELLIILTPHIIRNPMDAERIFMEESRKMSWSLDDVQSIHGALPGASFLRENCNENSLSPAIINPFDQNYFAPNSTQPGVDEKLNTPGTVQPIPQPMQTAPPSANPPAGNPPAANPPVNNPGWMQPPGATPPKFQQLPPGATTMTYGQAMQLQMAEQGTIPASGQNFQPTQTQQIGNYRTTVTYAPITTQQSQVVVPMQEALQRVSQPAPSNTGFASGGQQP